MDTLIITEKPEVGAAICKALGGFKKKGNAYFGMYGEKKLAIYNLEGHAMRLRSPDEVNPSLKWTTPELCSPIPAFPGSVEGKGNKTLLKKLKAAARRVSEVLSLLTLISREKQWSGCGVFL